LGLHVRVVLFRRAAHLLLAAEAQTLKGFADRLQTGPEPTPRTNLFQRGVGMLSDVFAQPLLLLTGDRSRHAAAVRFRSDRAELAPPTKEFPDPADRNR